MSLLAADFLTALHLNVQAPLWSCPAPHLWLVGLERRAVRCLIAFGEAQLAGMEARGVAGLLALLSPVANAHLRVVVPAAVMLKGHVGALLPLEPGEQAAWREGRDTRHA